MEDENDDSDERIFDGTDDSFGGSETNPFGFLDMMFTSEMDHEYSDELELGVKLMKAGQAMSEFSDFVSESDIDFEEMDQRSMMNLDTDMAFVVYGYVMMSHGLNEMAEEIADDDDDSNPFKVSDGDDPVH